MTLKFSGDFAALRAFERKINAVPSALDEVSDALAEEALTLIGDGFKSERDPYGKPWAPTQRGGRILQDRGILRQYRKRSVTRRGFRIAAGADYGGFHQGGTRYLKRRMMVPRRGRLPSKWKAAFVEAGTEILTDHFK